MSEGAFAYYIFDKGQLDQFESELKRAQHKLGATDWQVMCVWGEGERGVSIEFDHPQRLATIRAGQWQATRMTAYGLARLAYECALHILFASIMRINSLSGSISEAEKCNLLEGEIEGIVKRLAHAYARVEN